MKALLVSALLFVVVTTMACRDAGPLIGVLPDSPPKITAITIRPTSLLTGDPFTVSYTATAGRGIAYTQVTFPGFVDSINGGGRVSVSETVSVPAIYPGGSPPALSIKIEAFDVIGRRASAQPSLPLVEAASISGTNSLIGPDPPIVGEEFQLIMHAQRLAGEELAWIGYAIGAPLGVTDSVAVSGEDATATFRIVIGSQRTHEQADHADVVFFVRDVQGHRAWAFAGYYPYVLTGPRRPFTVAPLGGGVHDVLLDTLSGTLYLAQPDSDRILRLTLATMTFAPPIHLSGRPNGLDFSLGGDSLLVALDSFELGVVNLQNGAVSRLSTYPWRPSFVRQAANGKVFITTEPYGVVVDLDLSTGLWTRRFADYADWGGPIVPIGSRSLLAFASHLYTAATDTITPGFNLLEGGDLSSDRAGQYILTGNQLWTADFTHVRDYSVPFYGGGPGVISPDAAYAYISSPFGYCVLRLSDGTTIADVPVILTTPDGPMFSQLIPLPGGSTLIGVGRTGDVARIDLGPLSPALRR